ncbi:MAG: three-helix bundle dimerization domain-containing protein [Ilumatobacteraceae bacterium]
MAAPDAGPHLGPIVDTLLTRSDGAFEPTFVRNLVAEVAATFDGVRVRDYLEVLIAKEAADRLRRLQRVG